MSVQMESYCVNGTSGISGLLATALVPGESGTELADFVAIRGFLMMLVWWTATKLMPTLETVLNAEMYVTMAVLLCGTAVIGEDAGVRCCSLIHVVPNVSA